MAVYEGVGSLQARGLDPFPVAYRLSVTVRGASRSGTGHLVTRDYDAMSRIFDAGAFGTLVLTDGVQVDVVLVEHSPGAPTRFKLNGPPQLSDGTITDL